MVWSKNHRRLLTAGDSTNITYLKTSMTLTAETIRGAHSNTIRQLRFLLLSSLMLLLLLLLVLHQVFFFLS